MSNPINTPEFSDRAVSVYGSGDALDDFPVLKAFQQYIDAEQAKARKRLLAMGTFFGILMFVVIAIFVVLLMNVTNRNQLLNDRLIEFAMKDRPSGSAVVVQPPQDSSAILALTTKLESLQGKLAEAQSKADKALAEAEEKVRQANATAEAAKAKEPTPEELEIRRLKAQLAAEKEKAAAEKERRREEELEAYRRKHYPELYAPKRPAAQPAARKTPSREPDAVSHDVVDRILDDLDRLDDEEPETDDETDSDKTSSDEADSADGTATLAPVSYFDEDEEEPRPSRPAKKAKARPKGKPAATPLPNPEADAHSVSVKSGESSVSWGIPD